MADYDQPICIDCDDINEAVLRAIVAHRVSTTGGRHPEKPRNPALEQLAATVTAETYGRLVPEHHNAGGSAIADLLDEMDRPRLHVVASEGAA